MSTTNESLEGIPLLSKYFRIYIRHNELTRLTAFFLIWTLFGPTFEQICGTNQYRLEKVKQVFRNCVQFNRLDIPRKLHELNDTQYALRESKTEELARKVAEDHSPPFEVIRRVLEGLEEQEDVCHKERVGSSDYEGYF